jgi:hypothetical protein
MREELKWVKGSAVCCVNGRTLYPFTVSRGTWSMGVYAHDLEEAKRKLENETNAGTGC